MDARVKVVGVAVGMLVLAACAAGPEGSGSLDGGDGGGGGGCCLMHGFHEHGPGGSASAAPLASPTPLSPGRVDVASVPAQVLATASKGAHATYQNALAAVYDPDDRLKLPALHEAGWRDAGNDDRWGPMPAGFWVYSAPFWVVWDFQDGRRGGGCNECSGGAAIGGGR